MSLGSILGGLAGLLIPGGGAFGAALGSGLGGLIIDKKKPKEAIKDALIAGVGAKFFGPAIQGTGFGTGITSALSNVGIGGALTSAQTSALAPVVQTQIRKTAAADLVSKGVQKNAEKGILANLFGGNPLMLYGGLTALGAIEQMTKPKDSFKELYVDRYTGRRFNTPEERDEYEEMFRMKHDFEYPDGLPPRSAGFNMGGFIEGPGTGRSDSIPAQIFQDGQPVQQAALSDGEFVMTERAVMGAGDGDRDKGAAKMYAMMRKFEKGSA